MRSRATLLMAVLLALVLAAPSGAITYGELDGDAHPNVGALVDEFPWAGPGKFISCSGTLIAPRVFLTASHCMGPASAREDMWVTFDATTASDPLDASTTLIHGTGVIHPDYRGGAGPGGQSDGHDIAVVILDEPASVAYPGIVPASLPSAGAFAKAKDLKGTRFTAVGYGVHERERGPGGPSFPFDGDRWRAVSSFRSVHVAWLTLSQQDATGDGGTCYGDSGGPNFVGAGASETSVIAGITITGDSMCEATNTIYRLDTASARAFLDDFVAVP